MLVSCQGVYLLPVSKSNFADNAGRTLPAYTTVDQIFSRHHGRWLSALEKLTSMGFPATPSIAGSYKVGTWFILV